MAQAGPRLPDGTLNADVRRPFRCDSDAVVQPLDPRRTAIGRGGIGEPLAGLGERGFTLQHRAGLLAQTP